MVHKIFTTVCTTVFFSMSMLSAQYEFEKVHTLACSEIKSQGRTGTCWSFATSSMLESEVMRLREESADLSEMFVVRHVYFDKARNYLLRQGKANFSEGSLAHDVTRVLSEQGMVPESVYPGRSDLSKRHDHSEMVKVLKGALDGLLEKSPISDKWPAVVNGILDAYLGELPATFEYRGATYTPIQFVQKMGVDNQHYISMTSFSHHPFYEQFVLEIPDNYSNGQYYNVPLDELMQTIDAAIENGYTVTWDGDVSEKSFSAREGIAVLPEKSGREDVFDLPGAEVSVTQENRQKAFESFATTDDHLMHITGTSRDQNGNKYYIIKNSWGEIGPDEGFLHMSEAYLRMKTVGILVNKDAIPPKISSKIDM